MLNPGHNQSEFTSGEKVRIGRSGLTLEAVSNKIPRGAINRRKFRRTDAVSSISALLGRRQRAQAPGKHTKILPALQTHPRQLPGPSAGLLIQAELEKAVLFLMDNTV